MTRALVERLEAAEAEVALRDVRRRGGATVARRHGGTLVAVPGHDRWCRAYGVTLAVLDDEDVSSLVAWFADQHADPLVQLSPWAPPPTVRSLALAGFVPVWSRSLLACSPGDAPGPVVVAGVEVVPVGDVELESFLTTLLTGLRGPDAMIGDTDRTRAAAELADGTVSQWLALDAGEPVGAGIAQAVGDVVVLGPAATLASHRRRGVQTALLAARLAWARAAEADCAVVTAAPDSTTARNAGRAGFTLVEQQWVLGRQGSA